MLIDREQLAKHTSWIAFCVIVALFSVVWYVGYAIAIGRYPGGGTLPGLVFGISGGALILFEFLLWPRKKLRRLRLGKTRHWMRAHIWLGLLTVPLIVCHGGFWGRSLLVNVLMALFWIVIFSGIVGLALQQIVPKLLLHWVPAETIHSQIDYVANLYAREAEDLMFTVTGREIADDQATGSERPEPAHLVVGAVRSVGNVTGRTVETVIRRDPIRNAKFLNSVFDASILPYLREGKHAAPDLHDPNRARAVFDDLRRKFDQAQALAVIDSLQQWCDHRRQFELQRRLHWWLHGWLSIHLPLSAALVLLMLVHIVMALKYS